MQRSRVIILAIHDCHGSAMKSSSSNHGGMEHHDLFHGFDALSREEFLSRPSLFPSLLCRDVVVEEPVLVLVQHSLIQMMMMCNGTDLMALHSASA